MSIIACICSSATFIHVSRTRRRQCQMCIRAHNPSWVWESEWDLLSIISLFISSLCTIFFHIVLLCVFFFSLHIMACIIPMCIFILIFNLSMFLTIYSNNSGSSSPKLIIYILCFDFRLSLSFFFDFFGNFLVNIDLCRKKTECKCTFDHNTIVVSALFAVFVQSSFSLHLSFSPVQYVSYLNFFLRLWTLGAYLLVVDISVVVAFFSLISLFPISQRKWVKRNKTNRKNW